MGSCNEDAVCFGLPALVADIWFQAPRGDPSDLARLRAAFLAVDALTRPVVVDDAADLSGRIDDPVSLDRYFAVFAA